MKASDLLARYKPAERTVRILLDGTLGGQLDDLEEQLRRTQRAEARNPQGLATKVPGIRDRIAELEEEADAATVTITLRAMPGVKFDELKLAHPPTPEQWAEYKERAAAAPMFTVPPEVDALGMAPHLIALSIAAVDGEPVEFSPADGEELWATLHDGARGDLLAAAWEVNGQTSSRPFSKPGTDTTTSSGAGSTTHVNTESPSPSTPDE